MSQPPKPIQFVIALLLVLFTAGCNRSSHGKSDLQLNTRLLAIRQAGFPVTLPELNDWYAEPPGAGNAAQIYEDAFAALSGLKPTSPTFDAHRKHVLDLLHQAAARPKCRFTADLTQGANARLPHLSKLRQAAQLLADEANAQSLAGNMELTTQSLLDGLRLVRSLEDEPVLLSHMMQIGSANIIETALESILNRKKFSAEQLIALQTAFRETEKSVSLTRPLAGERTMGIAAFQLPPAEQVQTLAKLQKPPVAMDFDVYWKSSTYHADFSSYLELMDKAVTASASPFPQSLDEISQWTAQVREAKKKDYPVSRMLLPALQTAFERAAECVARLRLAQAVLAVERFQAGQSNTLPETLQRLTPQFLTDIPSDPFDGQPLRYEKLPAAGFIVYSVGNDREDDRGIPRPPGAHPDTAGDVTFIVKR